MVTKEGGHNKNTYKIISIFPSDWHRCTNKIQPKLKNMKLCSTGIYAYHFSSEESDLEKLKMFQSFSNLTLFFDLLTPRPIVD